MKQRIIDEDIKNFVSSFALYEELREKTILITGATGLIGATLVRCLQALNLKHHLRMQIVCSVRDVKKAKELLGGENDWLLFIQHDFEQELSLQPNIPIDYVIHCASPTASIYFVEHPAQTLDTILCGNRAILNMAMQSQVKSMVFLSSLEVYGSVNDDTLPVTEDMQGYINPMSARSSYPMGKRAAECMCRSYHDEYGVPVKVARLTQTMGAGVSKTDNRVFAQFARSAAQGKDIVLHTTGESKRPYLYTLDAVSAILYILLRGTNGESYNVANEDTYISINEMAHFVRQEFNPDIQVIMDLKESMGYAPQTKLRLSTKKLEELGWKPCFTLRQMFDRLIKFMTENEV